MNRPRCFYQTSGNEYIYATLIGIFPISTESYITRSFLLYSDNSVELAFDRKIYDKELIADWERRISTQKGGNLRSIEVPFKLFLEQYTIWLSSQM